MSKLFRHAIIDGQNVINLIEYEEHITGTPPGFEPPIFAVLATDGVGPGWTYVNGKFVAPPPVLPTAEQIKQMAVMFLAATDWTEVPSVSDPTLKPHLLNKDAFIAYRATVRGIAVSPQVDAVFPDCPNAEWSL